MLEVAALYYRLQGKSLFKSRSEHTVPRVFENTLIDITFLCTSLFLCTMHVNAGIMHKSVNVTSSDF